MVHADQDDVIAAALAAGKTQQQAADLVGVSRQTVVRRFADPIFQQRIAHFRRGLIAETLGLLMKAGPDAVASLALIAEGGERDSDRIKASERILEITLKIQASIDYEERLKAVEAQLGIGGAAKPERPTGEGGANGESATTADTRSPAGSADRSAKRSDAPDAGDGAHAGPVAGEPDHVAGPPDRGALHEAIWEDGIDGESSDDEVSDGPPHTGFDLRAD